MFRKFVTGLAAVLCISSIAWGANLSLQSGPQDPSQLLSVINTLIRSINTGVNGRLSAATTAVGTTTTAEVTLMTYSLPASQLAAAGDAIRVVCWGTTATNTNAKTAKLYFGNSSISSATNTQLVSPSNLKWHLELLVVRSGAATQEVLGRGSVGVTNATLYTNSGTDSLAAAVTVRCTGTTPTAAQDMTAQGMLVQQVK